MCEVEHMREAISMVRKYNLDFFNACLLHHEAKPPA
jgi:hypothetical protein